MNRYTPPPKNTLPVFNPIEFIPKVDNVSATLATQINTTNDAQETQLNANDVIYDTFKSALATSILTNKPPTQATQVSGTTYYFLNTNGSNLSFTSTALSYVFQLNGTVTTTGAITYLQIIVNNGTTQTYYYEIPQCNSTAQTVLNFSKTIAVQPVVGTTVSIQYVVSSTANYSMFNINSTTNYLLL